MVTVSQKRGPLAIEAKRREIIRLRYEGNSLARTAELVGLAGPSSVKHHEDAWLAERTPSVEVTEARRQMQLEAIDAVRSRLFEHVMRPLRDDDGCVIHGEDGKPIETPNVQVVDRIGKLWEREAKLLGLDLTVQVNIGINVSAEAVAALFADPEQRVIEGVAEEIVDA